MKSCGRPRALALLLLTVILFPVVARAHALLLRSTPQPHATLHDPHPVFELHFNSRIDGARSRLTLTTTVDSLTKNPFALAKLTQLAPETLRSAPAVALPAGDYTLHWIVLASDGHISRGEIPFRIE